MQIYDKWNSNHRKGMHIIQQADTSDFDKFMQEYGPENNWEAYNLLGDLGMYFEGIGVLVKDGLLDIRYVALLIAGVTRGFWEKMGPIFIEQRVRYGYPRIFSETEYLYNELMKYMEEHPELKA